MVMIVPRGLGYLGDGDEGVIVGPGALTSSAIAAWGDSLTSGAPYYPATPWVYYPQQLGQLAQRHVHNMGVGGETSTQIKTRLLADTAKQKLPTIIWAGRNNPNDPATVLADTAAMVSALGHSRYLVLSVIGADYDSTEYVGGSTYNNIATINAGLSAAYGSHYIDVRSYLVSLYNPGIPQDVIDFGHDIPPSSLRADQVHLNTTGYALVASKVYQSISLLNPLPTYGTAASMASVARDATSLKYCPSSSLEWDIAMSVAGITSGIPSQLYLCTEGTATGLTDQISNAPLNASGSPTGGNSVSGWTRKSVNTSDGSIAVGYSTSFVHDLSLSSAIWLGYVVLTGTPAAERSVMGVGSSTDHRYLAITPGGKFKAGAQSGATATGTATPGVGTVHPVVIKVDRSRSEYKIYTDQEIISPAWTSPTHGGKALTVGDSLSGGSPPAGWLYLAYIKGAAAELSDAQVRTLLQTLGWTIPW